MSMGHYTVKSAQKHMVDAQLRARGIRDMRVLQQMAVIPRERFVPAGLVHAAYEDRALDIGSGQTISQPYIVAYMTEQLELQAHHKVLEVGTGSGYQTALLAALVSSVYTIEFLPELSERARKTLEALQVTNVHYRVADGTEGWPEHAPFDRIMVTAGSPSIPPPLVAQLAVGGRLVIPVGDQRLQRMVLLEKMEDHTVEHPSIGCRFVKLVGAFGWSENA